MKVFTAGGARKEGASASAVTIDDTNMDYVAGPTLQEALEDIDAGLGNWHKIEEQTASASATIDFDLPAGYRKFVVEISDLLPATDNVEFLLRVSTDGGANFITTGYMFCLFGAATSAFGNRNLAATSMEIVDSTIVGTLDNDAASTTSWSVTVVDNADTSAYTKTNWAGCFNLAAGAALAFCGGTGVYQATTAVNAIRFLMSTGNIASGTFTLYGLSSGATAREGASASGILFDDTGLTHVDGSTVQAALEDIDDALDGWNKIQEQTASASSVIDFVLPSGYSSFQVLFASIVPATDTASLIMRTSTDGGANYDAGASDYSWSNFFATAAATTVIQGDTADTFMRLMANMGTGSLENGHGYVLIPGPSLAVSLNVVAFFNYRSSTPNDNTVQVGAKRLTAADVDAIRFLMSTGNIASGTFTLYGLKS